VWEREEGKVEGRYEEKRRPLHFFEVRSKCVFSYTFGQTFYLLLTDPKKDEGLKYEGCYTYRYFLGISSYSCD
jgi:hypothetical protein